MRGAQDLYVHAKSCPILCDPMDCSPPDSSVRGILQARILKWVAMPSFRGSSQAQGLKWTQISCIAGIFFTIWATRETLKKRKSLKKKRRKRSLSCLCILRKQIALHFKSAFHVVITLTLMDTLWVPSVYVSNFVEHRLIWKHNFYQFSLPFYAQFGGSFEVVKHSQSRFCWNGILKMPAGAQYRSGRGQSESREAGRARPRNNIKK